MACNILKGAQGEIVNAGLGNVRIFRCSVGAEHIAPGYGSVGTFISGGTDNEIESCSVKCSIGVGKEPLWGVILHS